jgi:hypothetical protein
MIIKAALAITAMMAAGRADASASLLAPIGPWRVSDDGQCNLSRSYGAADHPVAVLLRVSLGDWFATAELLAKDDGRPPAQGRAKLVTGSGTTSEGDYSSTRVPRSEQRLTSFRVDRRALDGLQAVDTLSLEGDVSTTIAIDGAKAAMAALRECSAKSAVADGIDPALLADGAAVPVPLNNGPAAWFMPGDNPYEFPGPSGYKRRPGGTIVMLFNVGTNGRVRTCRVVYSQSPPLDKLSCQIVKLRARYRPGTGPDGKPVASWSTVRVHWGPPSSPAASEVPKPALSR